MHEYDEEVKSRLVIARNVTACVNSIRYKKSRPWRHQEFSLRTWETVAGALEDRNPRVGSRGETVVGV